MRMTMMLLGAGSLALAACAQSEESTPPVAEQTGSGAVAAVEEPGSVAPEVPTPSPSAVPATPAPKLPSPTATTATSTAPAPLAKAAPKPSPKSEPSPAKVECLPEHREMGHC